MIFSTDVSMTTISLYDVYYNEFCAKPYPETIGCPAVHQDIFPVLHNYTNPRPITADEISHVIETCSDRWDIIIGHSFQTKEVQSVLTGS